MQLQLCAFILFFIWPIVEFPFVFNNGSFLVIYVATYFMLALDFWVFICGFCCLCVSSFCLPRHFEFIWFLLLISRPDIFHHSSVYFYGVQIGFCIGDLYTRLARDCVS